MITIIVGLPGAGKSYYASYLIWKYQKEAYEAYLRGVRPKYNAVFTNIEGIKESHFVKKLEIKRLEKIWKEELKLFTQWKEENTSPPQKWKEGEEFVKDTLEEKDPREKILEHFSLTKEEKAFAQITKPLFEQEGLTNSLIIIDEAHNWFRYLKPEFMRMVSYHRHYDMDIIFIVQDLHQLDYRLRNLATYVIEARNPILRLSPNRFFYRKYAGGYISPKKTNLISRFSVKKDPFIFRLYETGGYKPPPNEGVKIVLMLTLMAILGIGWFKFGLAQARKSLKAESRSPISTPKKKNPNDSLKKFLARHKVHYGKVVKTIGGWVKYPDGTAEKIEGEVIKKQGIYWWIRPIRRKKWIRKIGSGNGGE